MFEAEVYVIGINAMFQGFFRCFILGSIFLRKPSGGLQILLSIFFVTGQQNPKIPALQKYIRKLLLLLISVGSCHWPP